jgi:hypothetical protein
MEYQTTHPTDRSTSLVRDGLAVLLLWLLVVALFWRIALAGRVLAGGDIFSYFYPYWTEATRAVQSGRLPLWNPYLFMGSPFMANSQVGLFYPLNWLLWKTLPAHRSVHLTIVLHLCLAGFNGYLFGRMSFRMGRIGSWVVGATFALGGYLGAQVEHINQLQGLAWLPLMLALCDWRWTEKPKPHKAGRRVAFAALALVLALVLLAGHTQTAFISLIALVVHGLFSGWLHSREWRGLVHRGMFLGATVVVGVALAAIQLIPTWELAGLSIRAGGLPFNERVSFSVSPLYLGRALLPGFDQPVVPAHIEYVAYVGIIGLVLAGVGIGNLRAEDHHLKSQILLATLGMFLSLGLYNPVYVFLARYIPGFAHFRVPARWLTLTVLGLSSLAGWGGESLWLRRKQPQKRTIILLTAALVVLVVWAWLGARFDGRAPVSGVTAVGWIVGIVLAIGLLLAAVRGSRLATGGLLVLLVVEQSAAGSTLPHSRATAPQAFVSQRPAISHLLAAGGASGAVPARFISMSDITFDPGDLPEIELIYGSQLSDDALYEYVIAAKQKEVLSPNLPLAFGIPAVDGYDGGVLPLKRYVMLQRLFLPEADVSMDGRLRENLTAVPDGRWLRLFNVRHVITDKLHDAWLDDVFYDLQYGARLADGDMVEVAYVPSFEATAVGVVSYLSGGADLPEGTVVGAVEIGFGDGHSRIFELQAGEHTAEGLYDPSVVHSPATIGGHFWPGQPRGSDYVTRLRWGEGATPVKIAVRATLPEGELMVRGLSLIDERTGGFQALVVSDQSRFRLVHSGDVKIYENLDLLPRAFLVHDAVPVTDDEQALERMRGPGFDPSLEAVLSSDTGGYPSGMREGASETDIVRLTRYTPEQVEVDVTAGAPGLLILSDAWYPGWEASVDGELVPIHRADILFRAVAVDAGSYKVVFSFRPASLKIGGGVSLAGLLGLVIGIVLLSKVD